MNTDGIFGISHMLAYGLGSSMKSFIQATIASASAMELDEIMTKMKELDLSSSIEVCN